MYGSKLLETLDFLIPEEMDCLVKFLQSPYFFSDKQIKETYPLLQLILQFSREEITLELSKKTVYQKLYPNEKFIHGKIEKLMSALLKQVHQFIAIHFRKKKESLIEDNITLVNFFRLRNTHKFEIHYLKKLKKIHLQSEQKSTQYYFDNYLIRLEEIERYLFLDQRFDSFNYKTALQPLDTFYLLNKLEYACSLLSLDRFRQNLDVEAIIRFLDTFKALYAKSDLLHLPLIAIYYQIFEILKTKEAKESNYWKLKEMIQKNEKSLSHKSLKKLHGFARAFINDQYSRGASHLLHENFSLHKFQLEKGYLNYEKGILPSTFKNLVTLGLRTKSYSWVSNFLNEYKDKIEGTNNSKDLYYFNLSSYQFAVKEYEQALEFKAGQYEDLFYKNAAKRLELKIYYETNSEILDSKIDAFKVYIHRLPKNALIDHKRSSNNNFINFLRQIRNPRTMFSAERLEKLALKVEQCQFLNEKNWLLEKIIALKNNQ